ncbi:DUF502 domain-containing protein [Roseinatronobacter alkalisoli]|uniref:DUF502 domain-containing protein n=1 Tax=Roseinatronobacter alkalisoli TaxID=3028235 RepID=A0ABT5T8C0_9RHOB|nr:DUF502 domain-containing protein [Roseinatronobacter sp. HJB301]MDD7971226.1 DUF502 domain-containing protein [Roseinatronobacter sp. HJB301]
MSQDPSKRGLIASLRGNFIAGLAVIAPGVLTIWLVWNVITWIDGLVLPLFPSSFHPQAVIGLDVPGAGVIVFVIFTLVMGYFTKGLIGRTLVNWGERIVEAMPIIRSIYNAVKQIADTILARTAPTFDRACLVQYPRPGIWAMAFISTTTRGEIGDHLSEKGDMVSIFLPTTPNPTSGFLLFVPREDVIELNMSIEDAAKLVISAGLVYPDTGKGKTRNNGVVLPASDPS